MESKCEWRMSGGKRQPCGCAAEFRVNETEYCCDLHLSRTVVAAIKKESKSVQVEKI